MTTLLRPVPPHPLRSHSELDSKSSTTEPVHGYPTRCWIKSSMTAFLSPYRARQISEQIRYDNIAATGAASSST